MTENKDEIVKLLLEIKAQNGFQLDDLIVEEIYNLYLKNQFEQNSQNYPKVKNLVNKAVSEIDLEK